MPQYERWPIKEQPSDKEFYRLLETLRRLVVRRALNVDIRSHLWREVCRDGTNEVGSLHRSGRPRAIPSRRGGARFRYAANDALGDFPIERLPAASQPCWLSQPVSLHAEAAVGFRPRRRN